MSDLVENAFVGVLAELNEERGAALGRAGDHIDRAIERCRGLAAAIDALPVDSADRAGLCAEHAEHLEAFHRYRWQLSVQREAMGLPIDRWLERFYPTPPPR
jgi:hypothetical protein